MGLKYINQNGEEVIIAGKGKNGKDGKDGGVSTGSVIGWTGEEIPEGYEEVDSSLIPSGVEVGAVIGYTGQGVPEGYDLKQIGYSTEEQIIGTWTDGKNHYRKVISFTPVGTIPTNSWTTLFNYTFTDLNLLTKATVINTDSANSGEINWLTVQYFKTDNAFKGLNTRNSTVTLPANSLLVVEYTKTTDTGNFKYIEKKSATPIDPITGSIVDGTNIDNKTTNTYSANVIDGLINGQGVWSELAFNREFIGQGRVRYTQIGKTVIVRIEDISIIKDFPYNQTNLVYGLPPAKYENTMCMLIGTDQTNIDVLRLILSGNTLQSWYSTKKASTTMLFYGTFAYETT